MNESIVLEREFLLCHVDNALAQAFLQEAMNAVKNARDEDSRKLQTAVIKAMLVFHQHRGACEDCKAA